MDRLERLAEYARDHWREDRLMMSLFRRGPPPPPPLIEDYQLIHGPVCVEGHHLWSVHPKMVSTRTGEFAENTCRNCQVRQGLNITRIRRMEMRV